jgi:hypothetical protein
LSDDDMLLQSPKICCSPVVSLHSTTSVLATNYGDSVSNHDAQDTPSEIPDPAEEARLGPVLNNAPYSDIDTESPVDMVPPELSIEPQYSSEATTILTDKPNSVSQPLESPHVPSTADNCNDATIWNPSTDVLALNTVSQQAIGLGRHASPLSPSDGGNIIPVVQDETARCSTSPDAFDYSLAGYDLEPGHRDSTQPELSLVDNIITAPPPTNILTSAQHDVGTNPIGNDHPACEPSNHIRCLAGTLTDELLPMYGPSSPEAPRPRRCVPVEVNGPFVYTDRIFAWMDKRVQRHSIIRDSAARRGLDVSVRNPIPGAMERPPSNANSNDISVENEVMTPSDSLHGAVIVSSPSRLQVKIGHLQTLLEQRELLVATTELGVTSQSQPVRSIF